MQALVGIIAFVAILLLLFALRAVLGGKKTELDARLQREIGGRSRGSSPFEDDDDVADGSLQMFTADTFGRLGKNLAQSNESAEGSKLRERLMQAGYRKPNAVEIYMGVRILAVLVGALLAFFVAFSMNLGTVQTAMSAIIVLVICTVYPSVRLGSMIEDRQKEMMKVLPDAIDLIVVCVEAGLSVDQAIQRVANEIALTSPLLSKELKLTSAEIEAGIARAEAFRKLAVRTGIDELRVLSAMVIQAEQFGTSIAKSLKIQSSTMRVKRMQKVEEIAAKIPSKMTIPLIIFILPALFSVLLGPAIVRIIQTLFPGVSS